MNVKISLEGALIKTNLIDLMQIKLSIMHLLAEKNDYIFHI